jgi:hypothetical protein
VVRRLMAEGYNTGAIKKLIAGASTERLEALLEGASHPEHRSVRRLRRIDHWRRANW